MRVAILTFDGFNELDSFIALGLLNRLRPQGWSAEIASPSTQVTSMNGVTVQAQRPLEFANEADAVIFGSGIYTRAIAENSVLLDRLQLDPLRQLIAGQCSGVLLMARLGPDRRRCRPAPTRPPSPGSSRPACASSMRPSTPAGRSRQPAAASRRSTSRPG